MRTFTTLALGLVTAAVASASDVVSLTKDSFPDFIKENDLVLAECKCLLALASSRLVQLLTCMVFSLRSMCPHTCKHLMLLTVRFLAIAMVVSAPSTRNLSIPSDY